MAKKPNPTAGLRHVALYVKNFAECENFYTQLLGMTVVWRPDTDNLYLSSNDIDNLALHRAPPDFTPAKHQHLDHLGFFLRERTDVDTWFKYLKKQDVTLNMIL